MALAHAGSFRQRVGIMRRTGTARDDRGQTSPVFSAKEWLRAKVRQVSGRELERAKQVHAGVSWKVEAWAARNVSVQDRIEYGGRTLEVLSVADPDERGMQVVILCREVTA